jgi:Spy/CpxP family protein refolding chaperone
MPFAQRPPDNMPEAILRKPGLSEEQRAKLRPLIEQSEREMKAIREESEKRMKAVKEKMDAAIRQMNGAGAADRPGKPLPEGGRRPDEPKPDGRGDRVNTPRPDAASGEPRPPIVQRVIEELKLTPEQQSQIKPVYEETQRQIRELLADEALSGEQKRDKIRTLATSRIEKIKPMLQPEQRERLDQMEKRILDQKLRTRE